jgi:hypothetical protein
MRPTLTEFLGSVLDAPISRLRNYAIGVAVCAAAAIGAVYYVLAAAVLALEPQVGAVYARLIVAAAFAIIALCAIAIPRLMRTESITHRAQAEAKAMPKNDRLAMIIEALLLGFSASAGRKAAKTANKS